MEILIALALIPFSLAGLCLIGQLIALPFVIVSGVRRMEREKKTAAERDERIDACKTPEEIYEIMRLEQKARLDEKPGKKIASVKVYAPGIWEIG